MTAAPPGWAEATLGELGNYWNGRAFKKDEWRPPGEGRRPIVRIQDLTGSNANPNYFDGEAEQRHVVSRGDLLVSWAATLGVYEWSGPEAVVNQHIFKVDSFIDRRFHRYLIEHVLDHLRRRAHGTGMVHVTRKVFDETPVLLPPLSEQERIVAAIEEQLSRLEEADDALRSARRRVATCRRAVLNDLANTPGSLTRLADAATEMRYGTSVKCSYDGSGLPVLRIPNIQRGRVDTEDLKFAIDASADLKPCLLERGDLLFVRTNGSRDLIGRVAPVETDMELAFASYLIRLRPELDRVHSPFISMILAAPRYRWELESLAATTAGQYNLNLKSIGSIEVPLPPIEEQLVRAAEVEQQLSILAAIETSIEHALVRSGHLRRAILGMAFGGRLVSQDPSEEPAVELLSRIAAERPTKPAARRRKRA